jgi:hypothetical protein
MRSNLSHGITSKNKHVQNEHVEMKKCKSKKEATTTHAVDHGHQSGKKTKVIIHSIKTQCFGSENPYRKNDPTQIQFIQDLVLLITKGMKFHIL